MLSQGVNLINFLKIYTLETKLDNKSKIARKVAKRKPGNINHLLYGCLSTITYNH